MGAHPQGFFWPALGRPKGWAESAPWRAPRRRGVPMRDAAHLHIGSYGIFGRRPPSLWLDIGRADHLAPLLCFVRDELAEVGGRHRDRHATEVGKPRLHLG